MDHLTALQFESVYFFQDSADAASSSASPAEHEPLTPLLDTLSEYWSCASTMYSDSTLDPLALIFSLGEAWGSPAPGVNITDEVLLGQDQLDEREKAWPLVLETPEKKWGEAAPKINVTGEILNHHHQPSAETIWPVLSASSPPRGGQRET